MSEIKVGDRVRVARIDPEFGDNEHPDYQDLVGLEGEVIVVEEWKRHYPYEVRLDREGDRWERELVFSESELEVIA